MHFPLLLSGVALGMGLLTACGGGGGGGSSSSSTSTPPQVLTYTGPSTPAVIASVSDGQTLTLAALTSGGTGLADYVAKGTDSSSATPFLPGLLKALASNPQAVRPDVSGGLTEEGACGGSAYFSWETTDGVNYTGTATYNNYCLNPGNFPIVLNGTCNWTQYYPSSSDSNDFSENWSTDDLYVALAGKTYICNLTSSAFCTNNVPGTISSTCTYQAPDGKVYLASNYQVSFGQSGTTTISGTFYHPDYGSVVVATPTPLAYSDCSGTYLPTGGSLQITGANGVTATSAPQSCSTYQVCISNGTQTCQTFNWP
jgi:hypothetical protein